MRGGEGGRLLEKRLLCCLSSFSQSESLTNVDHGVAGFQPQLPGDPGHEAQPKLVPLKEEAGLSWHVQTMSTAKGAFSWLMN